MMDDKALEILRSQIQAGLSRRIEPLTNRENNPDYEPFVPYETTHYPVTDAS